MPPHNLISYQTIHVDIPVFTSPAPVCNDFDVTLANVSVTQEDLDNAVIMGNVEICLNASYFSICDTDWDDVEAQLICNALGLIEPFFRKFMTLAPDNPCYS